MQSRVESTVIPAYCVESGSEIGAGMSRFTWAWLQVKGQAGACQVERDVDTAVCNAWGGMYQYNATMVIGRDV